MQSETKFPLKTQSFPLIKPVKVLIFVDFIIVFFLLNTKKLGNFRKKNEIEGKSYGGGGGTNRIENHNNNNK